MEKRKIFFSNKKKKKNVFWKNKQLLYIDNVFYKKEKVFTLNSNIYYL